MKKNKYKMIDLFSGVGGLSEGFKMAGFTPVFANDFDDEIGKSYQTNHPETKFYKGVPNQGNHNTGYKGRTAIHEILEVNRDMKQLIFEEANQNRIKDAAKKAGMTTLREAGIEKILDEKTDVNEVLRATVEEI